MSCSRISIIVPSFNQGDYIEATLRSVLDQNYPALELIIMDGGSTDNTREVLERYADKLAHVEMKRDRGQSHARPTQSDTVPFSQCPRNTASVRLAVFVSK